VVALGVPSCGKWLHFASCGAFREKEMIETSRIRKGLWRSSSPFSFILFLLDSYFFLALLVISFNDSLVLFSPST
jgi:hypothetical protein